MDALKKYDKRIPTWDLNKLVDRVCPFCGCPNFSKKYLRPDLLNVVLCNECDTHFISPSPSENVLNQFYESYYVDHAKNVTINRTFKNKISTSQIYQDVRINVVGTLLDINGANVLDVGCGNGEFLLNLKNLGAEVTGIELSMEAVNEAHKKGLEHVFKVPFSEFNNEIKYDLIVLNDVVEHPLEPIKLIAKANSLLREGGLLLIWTPNNDNIFFDLEKKTLRVDLEHMQYLGSKACNLLSVNYHLDIVHYESLGYCTYSKGNKNKFFRLILIKLLRIFFLHHIVKDIYTLLKFKSDRRGNYHLFVVFKKSEK
jgi:2-polyprenyl-3-methyl-5-hydroxy-6-metoxy-1,4-benzoquinol methylase